MAGIGFRLQKLLSGESLSDVFRAYLYSSVIATGPMLIVIFTLAAVKGFVQSRLSLSEGALFMGLIVYAYAFSMLGIGPMIYVVTRYLADQYYLKRLSAFTPAYLASLALVFIPQALVAGAFLWRVSLPFAAQAGLFSIYLLVNGIWIAMVFLSAARSYGWIVAAFSCGGAAGLALSVAMGVNGGFSGFVNGYAAGQALTFFILTYRVFAEFGYSYPLNFGFLRYFAKYPSLALTGAFYYLAVWADKLIFWFSPMGESVGEGLRAYPDYDTPMFLAFLTIVPSMAFFLIQMETSFARTYRDYYLAIQSRMGLNAIRQAKAELVGNLTLQFQKFVLFQGVISGAVILAIYPIAEAFHLSPYQVGIFRIGILGAFLQMAFMMILNVFFYFDFRKEACLLSAVYFVTNSAFTAFTLNLGIASFGFGFMASCFVTVLIGFLLMNSKLKNLEFWTFMPQPIFVPKFKLESEAKPRFIA